MQARLSALDASFLYLEDATTPMHVGEVGVFRVPEGGFSYERLVELIEERISLVPRYRQRVRSVPGRLAHPVWVDDEDFDISYHVRRSALPRPGGQRQLCELVARVVGRRLDRDRPLWEMYLVEGLSDDRFAVITKSHHAMIDGLSSVDIGQVMLDVDPHHQPDPTQGAAAAHTSWRPSNEPSSVGLLVDAVGELTRRPTAAIDLVRGGWADVLSTLGHTASAATTLATTLRVLARPAPASPLNAVIGRARRFATADTALADYKSVRSRHGGTVNDVVLATVAGGLRSWLLMRGEPVRASTTVRAMVPVSVHSEEAGWLGSRIASFPVELPVGEPSPVVRLQRVSYLMAAHSESGHAVGADALVGLSGFGPPTMHALGSRVGSEVSRRTHNLVVTNVPGPQSPMYAAGALLLSAYPVIPLTRGQIVSIGVTSYNGGVFYGLNGDRSAMHDVDLLAQCIVDALEELTDTARARRTRPRAGQP